MTKICYKSADGTLKASVTTSHNRPSLVRVLAVDNLEPGGAFRGFGEPGDMIYVENMTPALPSAEKLEKLSAAAYWPDENEPNFVTVTIYRIVDVTVSETVDELGYAGEREAVSDYILGILGLTNETEYSVPVGAAYHYYDVTPMDPDLIVVKEIKALNI